MKEVTFMKITHLWALEVLDSRGNPTVRAFLELANGARVSASVPSGASTGVHEAHELRDGDTTRYNGKGVLKAVEHVNTVLAELVVGRDASDQQTIDSDMIALDGTQHLSRLGANALLAVSMVVARAGAVAEHTSLYRYLAHLADRPTNSFTLPTPMMNVLNGGKHAAGASDFQEYMIVPVGATSMIERVRWGSELFHALGKILVDEGFQTTVGDEGGYAPSLHSNTAPLDYALRAITAAGYTPGTDIALALDTAASEFYVNDVYTLSTDGTEYSPQELTDWYARLLEKYPIISLEDGHAQDDWAGFQDEIKTFGSRVNIVGDDLFVTNPKRIQTGIEMGAANALLVKPNQIGTLTQTLEAIKIARGSDYTLVVSHRSGETADTFIADLAVGVGAEYIKTGSLSRSERVEKYNRLLEIERELARF